MANRKPVKRITKHFQLRVEHPLDQHVLEVLNYAKSQKREVTVIREAITLFYALEQGNLDALFEAFPQYKAAVGGNGGGGQVDEDKLADRIAEKLAMLNGSKYSMQSAAPATTGKMLGGFKPLSAPVEDDDLPTLAVKKNMSTNSSKTFLEALRSMQ